VGRPWTTLRASVSTCTKEAIAVAVLRPDQEIPEERIIPNTPEALRASTYRVPEDEPELPTRIGSDLCGAPTR
jgi:hypothetical protein